MLNLILNNKENITSLELVKQINYFRKQKGNRTELKHSDLLKAIRDEFEEEINEGKISSVEYVDKKGKKRHMYKLTYNQAKQILFKESKYVRKSIIKYIEKLEKKLSNSSPRSFAEALKLAYEQQLNIEKQNIERGCRIV